MVIGRGGTGLEELKTFIQNNLVKKQMLKISPSLISELSRLKNQILDAYLVAKNVSDQLIRRLPAKRVLASTAEKVMGAGAKGVRIVLSGRVGGAEISRREKLQVGTVPLSTIRANINYASSPALTKKGYIGVKVWINRPEEKNNMLVPKRAKYRKQQRGMMKGNATRGTTVAFGEFGLMSEGMAWVTSRQIEAARKAITHYTQRGGRVWIRIFPDKPITKKPAETRMGSGKGDVLNLSRRLNREGCFLKWEE